MAHSPDTVQRHSPTGTASSSPEGRPRTSPRPTKAAGDRVFIVFHPDGSLQLHHCETMTVADVLLNHPFHTLSTSASNPVCLPLEKRLKPTGHYFLHKIRSSTDHRRQRTSNIMMARPRQPVRALTEPESMRPPSRPARPLSRHNSLKGDEFLNVPLTYVSAAYPRASPRDSSKGPDLPPTHREYAYSRPMEVSSFEPSDGRLSPLSVLRERQTGAPNRRRQPGPLPSSTTSSGKQRSNPAKPKNLILEEVSLIRWESPGFWVSTGHCHRCPYGGHDPDSLTITEIRFPSPFSLALH